MSVAATPLAARPKVPVPLATVPLTIGRLLDALRAHAGKALVFCYDGRDTSPGYHVTEVKCGQFAALDCGANPESWAEIFIQLWDIAPEPGKAPMSTGKFLAIMRKFESSVPFDPDAKVTFEVSDGVRAMQLFAANAVDAQGDIVRVALGRMLSSCKPRDR